MEFFAIFCQLMLLFTELLMTPAQELGVMREGGILNQKNGVGRRSVSEETVKKSIFEDHHHYLWWLLLHVRRATYRVRAKELFQYGISPEEATVLFLLQTIGRGATPAVISRWLLREPHSTSGLLQRMKNRGLIRKVKDLERKNLVRIVLTKKGQQVSSKAAKRESIHRLMSSLSEEECQRLETCFRKLLNRALDELGIVDRPFG